MVRNRWRIPFAFLFAPVLPCALVAFALIAASRQWGDLTFAISAMYVVSEALALALALPAFIALRRFWKIRLVECVLAGMFIGLVPSLAGLFAPGTPGYSAGDSGGHTVVDGKLTPHGVVTEVQGAVFRSCFGGSIGLMFWLIGFYRPALRKRPVATVSNGN